MLTYAISLDLNEKNAVLTALSKFPYEQVATLIGKIAAQVDEQDKARQETPPSA